MMNVMHVVFGFLFGPLMIAAFFGPVSLGMYLRVNPTGRDFGVGFVLFVLVAVLTILARLTWNR